MKYPNSHVLLDYDLGDDLPNFFHEMSWLSHDLDGASGGEEDYITDWFVRFHKNLGFSNLEGPFGHGPDYFAQYQGKRVGIEIEYRSSNIWMHSEKTLRRFDFLVTYHLRDEDRRKLEERGIKIIVAEEIASLVQEAKDFVKCQSRVWNKRLDMKTGHPTLRTTVQTVSATPPQQALA